MSERARRASSRLELAIGVGLLLFPVALLVLTLPSWSERQTTARSVAREVGRVVAVRGACDRDERTRTAAVMAENLGLAASELDVDLDCGDGARLERGCDSRRGRDGAGARRRHPRDRSVGEWSWTAHHDEPVDQYRSFDHDGDGPTATERRAGHDHAVDRSGSA